MQAVCAIDAVPLLELSTTGEPAGTIDPTDGADATGSTTVTYQCTKGTDASISLSATSGNLVGGTNGDNLAYAIGITSPGTATASTTNEGGFSAAASTVTVAASVAVGDYQSVSADTYTGSVNITITP